RSWSIGSSAFTASITSGRASSGAWCAKPSSIRPNASASPRRRASTWRSGPSARSSSPIIGRRRSPPTQATSLPVLEAQRPEQSVKLHSKTIILTVVNIFANVIGNFSLTLGMRKIGPDVLQSPLGYILALFDPWVAAGVGLLIVWMLSQMLLLSWADLSY